MKHLRSLLVFTSILFMSSCGLLEPEPEPEPTTTGTGGTGTNTGTGTGTGTGAGTGTGSGSGSATSGSPSTTSTGAYWSRNDGVATASLSLSGSVAKACANGKETIGTYKSSYPQSMTYVVSGNTITFPLQFEKNGVDLLVGVPEQGINTNTATYYKKASSYNCNSTGGGGTTTPVAKGSAIIYTNLKKTGYSYNVYLRVKGFEQMSYITKQHASAPSCSESGTGAALFGGLEPGNYSWRAVGYRWHASGTPTPTEWGGSITITSNGCTSYELK